MRRDRLLLKSMAGAAAAAAAILALFVVATSALLWTTLNEAQAQALLEVLQQGWPLLVVVAAAAVGAAAAAVQPWHKRWVAGVARLDEQARVLLDPQAEIRLSAEAAAAPVQGLAQTLNSLAEQRNRLGQDVQAQVAEGARAMAQERNSLAALMSELTAAVVVCTLDGRVLLYNNRARLQFRALSAAPALAGGVELLGLGRSIYGAFDRHLIAQALASVQQRLQRGAAHPSAQFVISSRAGQLLRVQLAPVRGLAQEFHAPKGQPPGAADAKGADSQTGSVAIAGFVLMLENITTEHEAEAAKERLIMGFSGQMRVGLEALQRAVRSLAETEHAAVSLPAASAAFASPASVSSVQLLKALSEQTQSLRNQLQSFAASSAQALASRRTLQAMPGSELLQAAKVRIESRSALRCQTSLPDAPLWLQIDSFGLLQALEFLAVRLQESLSLARLQLRLTAASETRAHLDLVWAGQPVSTETVMSWELDPMVLAKPNSSAHADPPGDPGNPELAASTLALSSVLTVRDVVLRHGGEFWFERDRARQELCLRFALPLGAWAAEAELDNAAASTHQASSHRAGDAADRQAALSPADSRPVFVDFDLFGRQVEDRAMHERALKDLDFTVFDTETTGLQPQNGDRIIQIGATRVVAGKLLRAESFDQLIDPQRDIPAAGIEIHGITPQMLRGMPRITEVLPAFHVYTQDTVLVAHNAAFDMRFLQLQEADCGVRFDQPVLDTLLLSAVVHPQQESHRLEAIAQRFGITVIGRHTALGDALVTAELFLKLLPLLDAMGIHTLGQALQASQKTYYASIKY